MKRIFQGDNWNKLLDLALEWMEENPDFIINYLDGYMKHDMYGEKTLTVIEIDYEEGV